MKKKNNQANAKQHPEAELLLFENYSSASSALWAKNNAYFLKNLQVCSFKWDLIINYNEHKIEHEK